MRITLITLSLVVYSLVGSSQTNNRILYVLPDSVEIAANGYIQHRMTTPVIDQFYCLIASKGNDTASITITRYERKAQTIVSKWLSRSNRSVMINHTEYPLLTDFDFKFGSPDEDNIGKMGNRDGYVSKVCPIQHAFCTILFQTDTGKVLGIEQN